MRPFDKYISEMKKQGKKLILCKYEKNMPLAKIDGVKKTALDKWVNDNQAGWLPLGGLRGSIKTIPQFEEALRTQLEMYFQD